MKIIGLTGSIAMGKSTVSRLFSRMANVTLYDADQAVHDLYHIDNACVADVAALFPQSLLDGKIDRRALSAGLKEQPEKWPQLEGIVHQHLNRQRTQIIQLSQTQGRDAVILDIPLLYEVGAEILCDFVVVVTASGYIQRRRVMARASFDPQRFQTVLSRQMPDHKKRIFADEVIYTGLGLGVTAVQVRSVVQRRLFNPETGHNPKSHDLSQRLQRFSVFSRLKNDRKRG